jgi:hypothetical protein
VVVNELTAGLHALMFHTPDQSNKAQDDLVKDLAALCGDFL